MERPRLDAIALERNRVGWWAVTLVVLAALAVAAAAFTGTFVFGLFVYYASRPVHEWVDGHLSHPGAAAGTTLLVVVLPIVLLVGYGAAVAFGELAALVGPDTARTVLDWLAVDAGALSGLLREPVSALAELERPDRLRQGVSTVLTTTGTVGAALLHLTLALTFAFFLMRDAPQVRSWFREAVGDRDSTAYAVLDELDDDLQTVYFGNVLTVLGVAVTAVLVYNGYNLLAPAALALPVPTLLALLTGLATFVPLVVGKLVYVPAVGYLSWLAVRSGEPLVYPIALLVVSFLLLDFVPQTVLRPLLSGRGLHSGLVLFGYVLGVAYFGWYGLFLGPLLVVLARRLVVEVVPDLLSGVPVSAGREPETAE